MMLLSVYLVHADLCVMLERLALTEKLLFVQLITSVSLEV